MNNWQEVRLEDIIDVNPSVNLKKGEEYPFIDIDKVSPSLRTVTNEETKTYDGQGSKFCPGDTVFSRITPCLENRKIAQVSTSNPGFGSTEFYVFRAKKDLSDPDYIYYLTSSDAVVLPAINSMSGASGRQRADKKFIQRLRIKVPNAPEQRKIAGILSAYDNLIEINNKRIKVLEQMAENLYKEWFVRFRFPGHETAEFENGLPKGWERNRISQYYFTSSGGTPSRENEENYENGTIPWIKTGEMQDCLLIDTEEHITEEAIKKSSAKLFPKDSVLMAMYGVNIGMLAYSTMDATCNQACCVFKDKSHINTRHYLFQYLKSIREHLLLIGFGAAQQNLSQDLIKQVKILRPDDDTIINFENMIEPLYQETKRLLAQNSNLVKQRDLLLPRLMSGELEVP